MYVCMYVCICMYVCVCTYVCIYVCIYIYMYMCVYVSVCMYVRMYVYVCTNVHLLYECELLKTQRDTLRLTVSKTDTWPANKYTLISRHYKALKVFINQIPFDEIQ